MRRLITLRFAASLPVIAAALLLCCISALLTTTARAQCPTCDCPQAPHDDAQYDTTPKPWITGDTCVQIVVDDWGDICWVHICYIHRQTSLNNFDYALTGVCVDTNCDADPDSTVLKNASWWLMQNNPAGYPAPDCPCSGDCSACHGNTIQWNENFINCWSYCGKGRWQICEDHGWCIDAYWVCKDPTTHLVKLCYDRSVHTTWQCSPGGQPPPCVGYVGAYCKPFASDGGCPSWMGGGTR